MSIYVKGSKKCRQAVISRKTNILVTDMPRISEKNKILIVFKDHKFLKNTSDEIVVLLALAVSEKYIKYKAADRLKWQS